MQTHLYMPLMRSRNREKIAIYMTHPLFHRVVLPVASPDDARTICQALLPRLHDFEGSVLAVSVVEKAGGAPDKASVEQREEHARDIFTVVESELGSEGTDVETEILHGTDIAETIRDAADEYDASAIVLRPRGGSRWVKRLPGDTATNLIENTDRPVVVLPDRDEEGDGG